jgi:hypothetical protein
MLGVPAAQTEKAPRKTAGLLFDAMRIRKSKIVEEEFPFFVDLAATYSSKP